MSQLQTKKIVFIFFFQILLHLARSIFEEQSNLECLVTKIMREARDLLKCERCAVYLLDLEGCSEEVRLKVYIKQKNFIAKYEKQVFSSPIDTHL